MATEVNATLKMTDRSKRALFVGLVLIFIISLVFGRSVIFGTKPVSTEADAQIQKSQVVSSHDQPFKVPATSGSSDTASDAASSSRATAQAELIDRQFFVDVLVGSEGFGPHIDRALQDRQPARLKEALWRIRLCGSKFDPDEMIQNASDEATRKRLQGARNSMVFEQRACQTVTQEHRALQMPIAKALVELKAPGASTLMLLTASRLQWAEADMLPIQAMVRNDAAAGDYKAMEHAADYGYWGLDLEAEEQFAYWTIMARAQNLQPAEVREGLNQRARRSGWVGDQERALVAAEKRAKEILDRCCAGAPPRKPEGGG